jgi:hypothetical protein
LTPPLSNRQMHPTPLFGRVIYEMMETAWRKL